MVARPEPRPSIRKRTRLGDTAGATPSPSETLSASPQETSARPARPPESGTHERVLIAHRVPPALKRRLALAKLITGQDQERLVAEAISHHLDQLGVPGDLPSS